MDRDFLTITQTCGTIYPETAEGKEEAVLDPGSPLLAAQLFGDLSEVPIQVSQPSHLEALLHRDIEKQLSCGSVCGPPVQNSL